MFQQFFQHHGCTTSSLEHVLSMVVPASCSYYIVPLAMLLMVWIVVEVIFYVVFWHFVVPRANERTPPHPFPVYCRATKNRHKLLLRLCQRLIESSSDEVTSSSKRNNNNKNNEPVILTERQRQVIREYVLKWFQCNNNNVNQSPSSSTTTTTTPTTTAKTTEAKKNTASGKKEENDTTTNPTPTNPHEPPEREETSSYSSAASSSSASVAGDDANSDGDDDWEAIPSSTAADSTTTDTTDSAISYWTIPGMSKDDFNHFFAWAFFGKLMTEMDAEELLELDLCHEHIKQKLQLIFYEVETSSSQQKLHTARRLTLEDVNPLHRPLLMYVVVYLMKILAGGFLRCIGFQRMVSHQTELVGWYRPAAVTDATSGKEVDEEEETPLSPLLFFHGIAPVGLLFYLPLLLRGMAAWEPARGNSFRRRRRACFCFENHNITNTLSFKALNEPETVLGVQEIVERALGTSDNDTGFIVAGHSFGSCPVSWLFYNQEEDSTTSQALLSFRRRIRQVVLLDPVTILLSEPDVMVNFLYSREVSWRLRLVARSELFTEYYLRRHFSWYNSELWLDDIMDSNADDSNIGTDGVKASSSSSSSLQVLVCLSGNDEIVPSRAVKNEIDRLQQRCCNSNNSNLRLVYWDNVGHADCVASPPKWEQIRSIMVEQEQLLRRETRQKKSQ